MRSVEGRGESFPDRVLRFAKDWLDYRELDGKASRDLSKSIVLLGIDRHFISWFNVFFFEKGNEKTPLRRRQPGYCRLPKKQPK